ncbi:MAG: SDR family NAD(P)-dependent oxidoreductase, partial [Leptospirales bacterium]
MADSRSPAGHSDDGSGRLVVLVTGAGAGIGRALADELIARGHIVYAGVRNRKRALSELAEQTERPEFRLVELDVNRPAQIEKTVKRVQKECGRLDVLVNNAGYGLYGAFEELPEAEFRAQLETNLFGAMRMARAVLPGMRARGRGRILNVSSILGRIVIPTGSAYT